jgi:hypothetical protein
LEQIPIKDLGKEIVKKRSWLLTLIALVALITAIAAQAQVVHRVDVGGTDVCGDDGSDPGCNANISLVALQFANGRVAGHWIDQFGDGEGFHANIDCLFVSDNEAWVSGVITHGTVNGYDLEGVAVATRVRDNGLSQNDPPDEISYSNVFDGRPCDAEFPYVLIPIPQGQVVVK